MSDHPRLRSRAMFTPPRSTTRPRLPTSSPSSARLRKLAPSPVKIPPPPYLSPSPVPDCPQPTASFNPCVETTSLDYSYDQHRKDSDPFGYDQLIGSRTPPTTSSSPPYSTNKKSRRHGGKFMMRPATATTPRNDETSSIPVIFDFCSPPSAEKQRHRRAGRLISARAEGIAAAPESIKTKGGRGEESEFAERLADVPESIRIPSSAHLPSSSLNTLWFDHPTPKCGSPIKHLACSTRTAEEQRAAPGADPGALQRVLLIHNDEQAGRYGYQNPTKPHMSTETLLESELYQSGRPSLGFRKYSEAHLLPSLDPASTSGASSGRSDSDKMNHLPPRDDRELSVAESYHTFGRPDRRPSAVSIEDEDGWSYSLSAYGGDDEDPTMSFGPRKSSGDTSISMRKYSEDMFGPSRKSSADSAATRDSLTSFGIPDFVHFIPPPPMDQHGRDNGSESTMELQTPRTDGSYAILPSSTSQMNDHRISPRSLAHRSDRSELFTPNYSVATLPRPSISSSGHSDSSSRQQGFYEVDPKRPLLSVNTATDYMYDEPSPRTRTRSDTLKTLVDSPPLPIPTRQPSPPIVAPSSSLLAPQASSDASSKKSMDRRSRASSCGSDQNTPPHIADALKSVDKSTVVTLIVDQEGAREVQTPLKYMKIHKPQFWRDKELKALEEATMWCETPSRPEPFQTTGCIEFGMDPKARAKWTFHHAALEGLPMLRRITVGEQDSHDYISRSATLQIRDSGVYAVHGTEDKGKVEWKFEYLVQPRFSNHTGEVITGEKIIIPLGFYVSPSFFNPDRATKLHLLSHFRKQLTPNIVSEKVKPPHIGTPPKPEQMTYPLTPTSSHVSSSSGGGFSRVMSKVKSSRSATTTPTEPQPFGTKNANRPSSRSRTPTNGGYATLGDEDAPKESKSLRRRATSLFGKSRPFTPPANITETHPVPRLQPMKSLSSLTSRRPHTAQASIRGEAPPAPRIVRNETFPPAPISTPGARLKRPATANAEIPPVPKITPLATSSHPFSTHVKTLPALPTTTSPPKYGRIQNQRPSTAQATQYPVTPRSSRRPSTALSSSECTPAHARLVTPNHQIVAGQAILISSEDRVSNRHGYAWRSGSEESVAPRSHKGLPPAPRRMMGRPATAQARLGTAM